MNGIFIIYREHYVLMGCRGDPTVPFLVPVLVNVSWISCQETAAV